MNANISNYPDNSKHLADYLDSLPWDFFLTGSTGYLLSIPSARRLAQRYCNMLPAGSIFFFVSEKFEARDSHHIHGLLDLKGSDLRQDRARTGILSQLWQLATGNRCISNDSDGIRWEIWNQIDLQPYMKSVGAAGYCAKYINKKRADYDLLINSCVDDRCYCPTPRPIPPGIAQMQSPNPVYRSRQKKVNSDLFAL